jgi:AraC-like DNA-binding protein
MNVVIGKYEATTIRASRIQALLHDAATLVTRDPVATQMRLDEISVLLRALQAFTQKRDNVRCLLAPWQRTRIRAFIDRHMSDHIRTEALAEQTRLSTSYFNRAFRDTFCMSPHAFILRCRTERAMELLSRGDEPIAHIAVACGFADQAHFSRVFSRHAGLPPGAWRRLKRGSMDLTW